MRASEFLVEDEESIEFYLLLSGIDLRQMNEDIEKLSTLSLSVVSDEFVRFSRLGTFLAALLASHIWEVQFGDDIDRFKIQARIATLITAINNKLDSVSS